ncbi:MAG: hypothetical protein L6290_02765 [Thermodesulfovibrionales bacterium]|nr:hypothetical protein [Thermodesulfovibrionales bacterium]
MGKTILKVFFMSVFVLALTASVYAQPANDLCADAIAVNVPSVTAGTTTASTFDDVGMCGTSNTNTSPGVWYKVVGTGNPITATTCPASGGSASYDSKISVFSGNCGSLTCIDGNDDFCVFQSSVTWNSDLGTVYSILVHGFAAATGVFDLAIVGTAPDSCIGAICYYPCTIGSCPDSWCTVYVPGLTGCTDIGQITYCGCTPPCPPSSCSVFIPSAP